MEMQIEGVWDKTIDELATTFDRLTVSSVTQRAISLSQTLKLVWPLRGILGITRISDISELDNIGIPVISAIRPAVNNSQITATQGKGLTFKAALTSALMEAVERHGGANYAQRFLKSMLELKSCNQLFLSPNAIGGNIKLTDQVEWVAGLGLHDNQAIYLPAADVLFPFHPVQSSIRPFRPSTTGLAAGNTMLEAIVSGINEVVERHATSKFIKYPGAKVVDYTTIQDIGIKTIIDKIKAANIDILILDLSSFAPLSVYYVSLLSNDASYLDIACAGQGAHLLPEVALRRALLESVQSRSVAIQGSREDLIRHAIDWHDAYDQYQSKREKLKSATLKNGGLVQFKSSNQQPTSTFQLLNLTYQNLKRNGYEKIYMTNLTHTKIAIPVVHILIPKMVDNIVDPQRSSEYLEKEVMDV